MKRNFVDSMRVCCGFVLAIGILTVLAPLAVAQDADPAIQVELAFGTGVDRETRELVGEAASFPAATERVFCRMHITGAEAPTTVTHAWYHEGKTMAQVELNVGSANWRTWSSKRLLPSWTGMWEVKVLDQTGKVLATAGFEVN